MIRNNKLLIAAGAAAFTASLYSATSIAGTITTTATAEVLQPLGISQTTQLDFGDIAADPTNATTVVLTELGAISSPDGASISGTATAGAFNVTGADGANYSVTLPANGDVTLSGGGSSMNVINFTSGSTGTLTGGSDSLTIGATLELIANQPAGTYTGDYTIIVEYQ